MYVADYGNHRIQRFDRNLSLISSFFTRDDPDQSVRFGYPRSVAQSRFGLIFLTDGENNRIVRINTSGEVDQAFGDIGGGEGRLESPSRIRLGDDDHAYVLDGNRIVVFDIFGNYTGTLGRGLFRHLRSIAVSGHSVYVLDSCAVYRLGRGGEPESVPLLDSAAAAPGLCGAVDIDVRDDRLYVLTAHRLISVMIDVGRLPREEPDK